MMGWLIDVAPHWVIDFHRWLRRTFFQHPRPAGRYLKVDAEGRSTDETRQMIVDLLGSRSYSPNWEFSYHKKGEIINLSRVVREESSEHPEIDWWQIHVRGWDVDEEPGAIHLRAHWEPEPTENPTAHLDMDGFHVSKGLGILSGDLEQAGIDVEEVIWRGA